MNIKVNVPKYSDGEIHDALIKEIKTGFQLERALEHKRVERSRMEAQRSKGKRHPVLGECIAVIPQKEFMWNFKKYGNQEVHSKEFLKYFNKKFPDLSPNKI